MFWFVGFWVAGALAQPLWNAPLSCPSADEIHERVLELSGTRTPPSYAAEIQQEAAGYTLRLRLERTDVVVDRELRDESCEALSEAAVLTIVSLAESVEPETPSLDEPTPEQDKPKATGTLTERKTEPKTASAPSVTSTEPKRRPLRFSALLGSGADFGYFASIGWANFVGLALDWGKFRIVGGGTVLGPRALDRSGVSAGYIAGTASLELCYRITFGALALPLCAGAEAGGLRLAPRSLGRPKTETSSLAAATAAAYLSWSIRSRISLFAGVKLSGSVLRPSFTYTDSSGAERSLHQVRVVGVRPLAGLEL